MRRAGRGLCAQAPKEERKIFSTTEQSQVSCEPGPPGNYNSKHIFRAAKDISSNPAIRFATSSRRAPSTATTSFWCPRSLRWTKSGTLWLWNTPSFANTRSTTGSGSCAGSWASSDRPWLRACTFTKTQAWEAKWRVIRMERTCTPNQPRPSAFGSRSMMRTSKMVKNPTFKSAKFLTLNFFSGCLKFIRASHNNGIHRRYIRNPDKDSKDLLINDRPEPVYQLSNFTACPVKKGEAIESLQPHNFLILNFRNSRRDSQPNCPSKWTKQVAELAPCLHVSRHRNSPDEIFPRQLATANNSLPNSVWTLIADDCDKNFLRNANSVVKYILKLFENCFYEYFF